MSVKSYLGLWEKRVNFGIIIVKIQQKVWERRRKRGREKMLNFGNVNTEIPLPSSCWPCVKCAWSAQSEKKKKNLWQTNCGNAIVEIGKKKFVTIVAMALPKMGEKMWFRNLGRSKKKKVLRSQYFHNKSHVISYY